MKYDKCLKALEEMQEVSKIEESRDMNGQFIVFTYTNPKNNNTYSFRIRFRYIKKHQRITAFYLSKDGDW